MLSHSVVSNSFWSHGLQPARLLRPWNSPGQNIGVGSRSHLQGVVPTQGSNPGFLHCSGFFTGPNHQGSPPPILQFSQVTVFYLYLASVTFVQRKLMHSWMNLEPLTCWGQWMWGSRVWPGVHMVKQQGALHPSGTTETPFSGVSWNWSVFRQGSDSDPVCLLTYLCVASLLLLLIWPPENLSLLFLDLEWIYFVLI